VKNDRKTRRFCAQMGVVYVNSDGLVP